MANINIKLSQDVVDQQHQIFLKHGTSTLVTGVVDFFAQVSHLVNAQYYYYDSYSYDGSTFRANYPDGSFSAYTGTSTNTSASTGTANITTSTFFKPNDFSTSSSGSVEYQWFSDLHGPIYRAKSGTLEKINLITRLPSSSPDYDSFVGNMNMNLVGSLKFNEARDLSGSITEFSSRADKLLSSSVLNGNIEISGNLERIGLGLEKSNGSGSISFIEDKYYDGSNITFDFRDLPIQFNDISLITPLLEKGEFFTSDDVISIDLPSILYKPSIISSGAGNDIVSLKGGGGNLSLNAGAGNDAIYLYNDNHTVDGGEGFDTIIYGSSINAVTDFSFSPNGQGVVLSSKDGIDTLTNVEKIQFSDGSYSPYELRQFFSPTEEFSAVRNGQAVKVSPVFFTGSESLNLNYQFIDTTPDSVVIGSNLNDFIAMQGGGLKAVNGGLGNDVIDGGVGSTFISGGGGSNTFFLDGRASGVSWSTITDFAIGVDKATIWGWKKGISKISLIQESGGADGFQGLTMHFENLLPSDAGSSNLNPNWNSITLTDKSLSDFGASSADELIAQINAETNPFFSIGQTPPDQFGVHGYLHIA